MKIPLTLFLTLLPTAVLAVPRLLGPLQDSVPPLPPPPLDLPEIAPRQILQTNVVDLGNTRLTVQKVTDEVLTPLPDPPAPALAAPSARSPEWSANLAESQARQRERALKTLELSAVVHRSKAFPGQVRTLFHLWIPHDPESLPAPLTFGPEDDFYTGENQPLQTGTPIVFWSTMDANYLSPLPAWEGLDGMVYEPLHLSVGEIDLDQRAAWYSSKGRAFQPPAIPSLPEGAAAFQIVRGTPSSHYATAIRDLHALYEAELTRLKTAFDSRQRARKAQADYLDAHPVIPPAPLLRYRLRPPGEPEVTGPSPSGR